MSHLSRRAFIRQAACAGVGTAGIASTIWYLRAMNAAAGLNLPGPVTDTGGIAPGDFKALVCVFLYGGNDSANMLLPYDATNYGAYQSARSILALPQNSILPISHANSSGLNAGQYGVNSAMPEIQSLFNSGKAAFIANAGTLAAPVTRATYLDRSAQLPPQLFSHEDQQIQWQTSWPDSPQRSGWGGRMADLINTLNGSAQVSMSISLAGTNTFEVGNQISQYQVGSNGSIALSNLGATSDARYVAYNNIVNLPYTNLFERAFAATTRRAIDNNVLISSALTSAPTINTVFPSNSNLAAQLKMVARMISIRSSLGHRRQIYFVSQGGYDTHADELANHGPLLSDLSKSLKAFYDATVELGVANMVTSFTASDFGRTFTTNGQGSDHGWGSHHMVIGGDVRGGDIYGRYPVLTVNGPDDTGYGRWIPSTAVDEYSMKLATWFGITPAQMSTVFPNIGRFNAARTDLSFMS